MNLISLYVLLVLEVFIKRIQYYDIRTKIDEEETY